MRLIDCLPDIFRGHPKVVYTNKYRETQQSISDWAEDTFGSKGSNWRVAARANEEMAELLSLLSSETEHTSPDTESVVEEIADVIICLYRLAERLGVDIHEEVDKKMLINRSRKWNTGPDGIGYHVD